MCLNTSGLFQICLLCPNSLRILFLTNFSDILTTTIFGTPSNQLIAQKHSTDKALLRVLNDLLTASDSGSISILTLLGLRAAFDTIDHSILLVRLESTFGIRDLALSFFCSYLQDRTQIVTVNEIKSSPSLLTCGVSQGSVLGPVFFILYSASFWCNQSPLCLASCVCGWHWTVQIGLSFRSFHSLTDHWSRDSSHRFCSWNWSPFFCTCGS